MRNQLGIFLGYPLYVCVKCCSLWWDNKTWCIVPCFFFFLREPSFAHLLSKGFNRRFHPQLLPLFCLASLLPCMAAVLQSLQFS